MKHLSIHGTSVPALGFGTLWIKGDECRGAVMTALEVGYRHIDTAQAYENEAEVGDALRDSSVPRGDIFLTTKLYMDSQRYPDVKKRFAGSLRDLKTDYVDLFLVHWPSAEVPIAETMRAMNEIGASGAARHIGVSNFPQKHISEARALAKSPIFTNQIEYHALLGQDVLLREARQHGSLLTAYSPLARGKISNHPVLAEIGARYGKSATQIGLRWLIDQDNVSAIPRTSKPDHIRSNFEIFDFELRKEDTQRICDLPKDERVVKPAWAPRWDPVG